MMKIIAGISNANSEQEIKTYVEAGVNEFFIGYIPKTWSDKYGWEISCNRRQNPKAQYKSVEELANVVNIIHKLGCKAFLTLNEHEYNNELIELVHGLVKDVEAIGFDAYIISNLALMIDLRKKGIKRPFNISIGGACNNFEAVKFYYNNVPNIGRVILPRKVTISEVEKITDGARKLNISVETFGMSSPCDFSDEYCFSWHCGHLPTFCKSPMYKHRFDRPITSKKDWKKEFNNLTLEDYLNRKFQIEKTVEKLISDYETEKSKRKTDSNISRAEFLNVTMDTCGFCAFQKFKDFGVDAIKIALRGLSYNGLEMIKLARKVIDQNNATPGFCQGLIGSSLFCNGDNCYFDFPYKK
jgi:U32 family peptidase